MGIISKVFDEVGLARLFAAPRDAHWLIFIRLWRLFAFGQCSIIIVQFFDELGLSARQTGLFMALTLVGDMLMSLLLTRFADGLGRRKVLLWGAFMMAVSGSTFAMASNYYVLLTAAIIGVISPSGGEIGPFRAIEESTLAHILPLDHRSDIYAWYGVLGAIGASSGSIFGGNMLSTLQDNYGYSRLESYRVTFWLYTFAGVVKFVCTMFLSKDVELEKEPSRLPTETTPLVGQEQPQHPAGKGFLARIMPNLSEESRRIVPLLSLLFALDAFASSMSTISWIAYFVARKFQISDSSLGTIFFTTGIVGAFASLGGSSISKRLGPLLTMVVTHLPSSSILIFIPFPSNVAVTVALLVIRACTATMDVAPRQVFLSAVILKEERTAVMGWVNVVKTGAQIVGPYITGQLTAVNMQWLCFVLSGSLKVLYDLGILFTFMRVKLDRDA
nr:ST.20 [Starmerella bombicola]